MSDLSSGLMAFLAACAGVGFLVLWASGAGPRGLRPVSRRPDGPYAHQPLSAATARAIDRRVALLEAERGLPAGWTGRDARRLLRIAARRGHFIRSSSSA